MPASIARKIVDPPEQGAPRFRDLLTDLVHYGEQVGTRVRTRCGVEDWEGRMPRSRLRATCSRCRRPAVG